MNQKSTLRAKKTVKKVKQLPIEVADGVAKTEETPKQPFAETTDGVLHSESKASKSNLLQEIEILKAEGKTGTPEFVDKMRKLEVILGISQVNPFGTNEPEIFRDNIKEMSVADLQALARKVGISPYLERPVLKQALLKEFDHFTKNSRRNIIPTASSVFQPDPKNPKHAKLIKILGDI